MRVVVTGAAGQIGQNLVSRLLEQNLEVIAVDDFSSGEGSALKGIELSNLQILEHDILMPLPDLGKVDRIYHLAAPASPVFYLKDPIRTADIIVEGTRNVLKFALQNKARFFLASTSEVYGDPMVSPQSEGYWGNVNPVGARACYKEAKRYSETITSLYAREHSLDTRIARMFNTYGPGANPVDGRVVTELIIAAAANQPMTIHGDGSQTRSFCFVDDTVKAMILLMESEYSDQPVNIGNPEEITILELAEVIKKALSSESAFHFLPSRPDDPMTRKPDISLVKNVIGWEPETTLEQGILETFQYIEGKTRTTDHQLLSDKPSAM